MKPKGFFFHGQHGYRYSSRVRTVSDNDGGGAAVSRKHGYLSHAGLVNIRSRKASHQLNETGYSCQRTAVKTRKPLNNVTWPYRRLRCSLWGCLLDNGITQDSAQRIQVYRSSWVNLCMQLTSLQFDMGDIFHGQLTAVKSRYPLTSITWPYCRLKRRAHRDHVFSESLPLTTLWIFIVEQAEVFSQILRTSP